MTNATPDQLNRIESLVQANAQAIQELGQKFDQLATEVEIELIQEKSAFVDQSQEIKRTKHRGHSH